MIVTNLYKRIAKSALKGNWIIPMLVIFIGGLFATVGALITTMKVPNLLNYIASDGTVQMQLYVLDTLRMPKWVMPVTLVCLLLTVLVQPMMSVSANHYLMERLHGNDIGLVQGLFCRVKIWGKAVWLYVRMGLQIFLWSLLLVVPGILAAIRYAMAPYLLAENPDMSVSEALEQSKQLMNGRKASFVLLTLSIYVLEIIAQYAEIMLGEVGIPNVLLMVAAQFFSLWVSTYLAASHAAFCDVYTSPNAAKNAVDAIRKRMEEQGVFDEHGPEAEEMLDQLYKSLKKDDPDADPDDDKNDDDGSGENG